MNSLQEILNNARHLASENDHRVLIYDRGDIFITIVDNDTDVGGATLAYIVNPDGTVEFVDG